MDNARLSQVKFDSQAAHFERWNWKDTMEIKIEITCSCGNKSMVSVYSDQKEYTCESCGSELFKAHISTGYVYILSNPSMPNLLKIGFTERDVDERVDELNSTGVPVPFEVEAVFGSPNAYEDEQAIHNILDEYRLASNREFFSIDIKNAIQHVIDYINSDPSFIKSPELLLNDTEKQALREKRIKEEEKKQEEEKARHDLKIKEQEQRKMAVRRRNLSRKKLYIEQIKLSDPELARRLQLKYEVELKETFDTDGGGGQV